MDEGAPEVAVSSDELVDVFTSSIEVDAATAAVVVPSLTDVSAAESEDVVTEAQALSIPA